MNNNYQNQQYIIPPPQESVVHVTSEQDALNYPIAPGNTVYFINDAANIVYKRGVSIYGVQALPEIYDFVKREQVVQQPQPSGDYMTKKDVEDLILDILGRKEGDHAK